MTAASTSRGQTASGGTDDRATAALVHAPLRATVEGAKRGRGRGWRIAGRVLVIVAFQIGTGLGVFLEASGALPWQ